jgi:murein L,D-transpeptidase YafK
MMNISDPTLAMCRVEGGTLHIHGNVNDSDETRWLDSVVESISNIAKAHGKTPEMIF